MALVFGMTVGAAIGAVTNQMAVWIGLGLAFGVIAQGVLNAKKKKKPEA